MDISAGVAGAKTGLEILKPAKSWLDLFLLSKQRRARSLESTAQLRASGLSSGECALAYCAEFQVSNIEAILSRADALFSSEGGEPSAPSEEWFGVHVDSAQNTSDEDLREIWARLLVAESFTPGMIAKDTLRTLEHFDKSDADLVSRLFQTVFRNPSSPFPAILAIGKEPYLSLGLDFDSLMHLADLKVIRLDAIGGFVVNDLPGEYRLHYFDMDLRIKFGHLGPNAFRLGHADLTRAGKDLFRVVSREKSDSVLRYCVEFWEKCGLTISCGPILSGGRELEGESGSGAPAPGPVRYSRG